MNRPVTMKDIARAASVTSATVSMALRGNVAISEATRARVHFAAKQLGYQPNAMVSVLMSHVRARRSVDKCTPLAWVTAFPKRDDWKALDIYQSYFEGAKKRAQEHGYRLEEFWAKQEGMNGSRLTEILQARNIRGLFIAPFASTKGHLSLDWSKFALATVGYSMPKPEIHRANLDIFDSVVVTLRKLKRLGYQRIGFVCDANISFRINYIDIGAVMAFQNSLLSSHRVPPLQIKRQSKTDEEFSKWLMKYKPDAVCSFGRYPLTYFKKHCIRVPEDIGFANLMLGIDDSAGIRLPYSRIGAAAIDLLIEQINNNEFGIPNSARNVLIKGEWQNGPTIQKNLRIGSNPIPA